MSALAWVALAGWGVATVAGSGWFIAHQAFNHMRALHDESDNNFWKMVHNCDWWIRRHHVAEQQALDDRAACDAMREELQRMKGKK